MLGRSAPRQLLLRAVVVLVAWCYPQLAFAETDQELRDRARALIETPPTGTADAICAVLEPLFWRLQERAKQAPDLLEAPRDSLQLLRQAKKCGKCTKPPCPTAPPLVVIDCQYLSDRLKTRVARYEACTNQCNAEDVVLTFVDVVKECPRGDSRVSRAISSISIVVAPKDILARVIMLLRSKQIEPKEALNLLEEILRIGDAPVRYETLKLLLASDPNAGATLELLKLAHDLDDLSKAPAMRKAIHDLLLKYPDVAKDLPPDYAKRSLEQQVAALVRLLNSAQILELNQDREKAAGWPLVSVALRRLRLKFAAHLGGCTDANNSSACNAAKALKDEFLKTLRGESPQSADEIDIDEPLAALRAEAEQVLRKESVCDELKARKARSHDSLCESAFVGFVGLEVEPAADSESLRASVTWVVRGVNDVVEACSSRTGGCISASPRANLPSATAEGANLARLTLRKSSVSKWLGHVRDDPPAAPRPQPTRESAFAKRWRQIGRPIALLGTLGLVTSGVYVSNTQPNKSTGDWLWRGGIVLCVVEIGVEGWLYFE